MQTNGAILMPAYEPDEKLVELITRLRRDFAHLVVVDDGSVKEGARKVFERIRGDVDVLLVHKVNRGKGVALRTGIAWIRDHLPAVCAVVTADSDGQHASKDIVRVAEAAVGHPDGLVLGVREFTGTVPFRSRFGNMWTRILFWLLTGLPVRDTQTGLRAIPRGLFDRMLMIVGDRYEYEIRMLVDARHHAAKPLQLTIETIYINDNRASHFHPFRDTVLTQWALCSARFLGLGLPKNTGAGHAVTGRKGK